MTWYTKCPQCGEDAGKDDNGEPWYIIVCTCGWDGIKELD